MSSALAGGLLTTASPGKYSLFDFKWKVFSVKIIQDSLIHSAKTCGALMSQVSARNQGERMGREGTGVGID